MANLGPMSRHGWLAVVCATVIAAATSCAATPPGARVSPSSTTAQAETIPDETEGVLAPSKSPNPTPPVADGTATTLPPEQSDVWPLTGVQGQEIGRWPALLIKIDNHDRARPQFGINAADVVFEEIVEGGLTRLAAIFHSEETDIVGPVRSVRTSDFDLLRNLNRPLFANSGGNEAVLELLRDVDYVDVSSNADLDSYRRLSDRPAPHNLVTSTKTLRVVGDNRGGGANPPVLFIRRSDNEPMLASATTAKGVDLDYGATSVTYRWDPDAHGWMRRQNGSLHLDASGVPVAPEIVIVQTISYRRSAADGRSPEAVMIGEGPALVLYDGHVLEGYWERPDAGALTRYMDRDGQVIVFPPGSTWIALPRVGQVQVVE